MATSESVQIFRIPSKEWEVFVSEIPPFVHLQVLRSMFEKYGEIYTLRLVPNSADVGNNYAFVRFTEESAVEDAIKWWNGYEISRGYRISVCKAVDNKQLVLTIPRHVTSKDVYYEIRSCTVGLVQVYTYPSEDKYGTNSGMAFLRYSTHKYAAIAKELLTFSRKLLWNRRVFVDWDWDAPCLEWEDWPSSETEAGILYPNEVRTLNPDADINFYLDAARNFYLDAARNFYHNADGTSNPNAAETWNLDPNAAETWNLDPNAAETWSLDLNGSEAVSLDLNGSEAVSLDPNESEAMSLDPNGSEAGSPQANGTEAGSSHPNLSKNILLIL